MIAQVGNAVSFTRRALFAAPLALLPHAQRSRRGVALASSPERELVATVRRDEGLLSPLTLGMARVVLPPGASAWASTPSGARMIVVESGVLAIATTAPATSPFTAEEFAVAVPVPAEGDEFFVPAGMTVTFGTLGVARVHNPGARSVVVLDVAVFHEEPRPISRAFTTEDGISFQLLASASAAEAPGGRVALTLERVRLGAHSALPADLSRGLTLTYVEAGAIELSPIAGEVFAARAAASTPYSMPGSMQPVTSGVKRSVTAGGVVFLPVGAECEVTNDAARAADILTVAVREVA